MRVFDYNLYRTQSRLGNRGVTKWTIKRRVRSASLASVTAIALAFSPFVVQPATAQVTDSDASPPGGPSPAPPQAAHVTAETAASSEATSSSSSEEPTRERSLLSVNLAPSPSTAFTNNPPYVISPGYPRTDHTSSPSHSLAVAFISVSGVSLAAAFAGRILTTWAKYHCELGEPGTAPKSCSYFQEAIDNEGPLIGPSSKSYAAGGLMTLAGSAGAIVFSTLGGKYLGYAHAQSTFNSDYPRLSQARESRLLKTGFGLLGGGIAAIGLSTIPVFIGLAAEESSSPNFVCDTRNRGKWLANCGIPFGTIAYSAGVAMLSVAGPLISYPRNRRKMERRGGYARIPTLSPFVGGNSKSGRLVGLTARGAF